MNCIVVPILLLLAATSVRANERPHRLSASDKLSELPSAASILAISVPSLTLSQFLAPESRSLLPMGETMSSLGGSVASVSIAEDALNDPKIIRKQARLSDILASRGTTSSADLRDSNKLGKSIFSGLNQNVHVGIPLPIAGELAATAQASPSLRPNEIEASREQPFFIHNESPLGNPDRSPTFFLHSDQLLKENSIKSSPSVEATSPALESSTPTLSTRNSASRLNESVFTFALKNSSKPRKQIIVDLPPLTTSLSSNDVTPLFVVVDDEIISEPNEPFLQAEILRSGVGLPQSSLSSSAPTQPNLESFSLPTLRVPIVTTAGNVGVRLPTLNTETAVTNLPAVSELMTIIGEHAATNSTLSTLDSSANDILANTHSTAQGKELDTPQEALLEDSNIVSADSINKSNSDQDTMTLRDLIMGLHGQNGIVVLPMSQLKDSGVVLPTGGILTPKTTSTINAKGVISSIGSSGSGKTLGDGQASSSGTDLRGVSLRASASQQQDDTISDADLEALLANLVGSDSDVPLPASPSVPDLLSNAISPGAPGAESVGLRTGTPLPPASSGGDIGDDDLSALLEVLVGSGDPSDAATDGLRSGVPLLTAAPRPSPAVPSTGGTGEEGGTLTDEEFSEFLREIAGSSATTDGSGTTTGRPRTRVRPSSPPNLFRTTLSDLFFTKAKWIGTLIGGLIDKTALLFETLRKGLEDASARNK